MPTPILPDTLTWRVTPDILGILDSSGVFRHTNPAWQRTLGVTAEEIETHPFIEFVHPEDVPRTERAFELIQAGSPVLNFENRYRHKDGSYRWLSWNAVPEGDYYFCNARDVTLAKKNETRLRTREREAQFRDQFIAVLGHDLRNPVAAIAAALRLALKEKQTDSARQVLELAQGSTRRMSDLIDDVLDFARAELGNGIDFDLRSTDLKPAIEQAAEEIRVAHPGITLEVDLDFTDPVTCDPDRIAQMVSNLLGNAVTHGREHRPIRLIGREESDEVVISVENEGDEIPQAIQPLLFQPFARHDIHESQNGLGLGLYIVNKIATGHEGTVEVSSDPEHTVFTFRLPRR